jgi:hypothetical protein
MKRGAGLFPPLAFPVRGVRGGWRDWQDGPDDHAALRTQAELAERQCLARMQVISRRWQDEILAECWRPERERSRRGGLR